MSRSARAAKPQARQGEASLFAALGDETRLKLIGRLCRDGSLSISELAEGSRLTRQAITKHLRVLEGARLVRGARRGRKRVFTFAPGPIEGARDYLVRVFGQWEQSLARLKAFVEDTPS